MPPQQAPGLKPGQIKDPKLAALFSTRDPEARFDDLKEIGHGSFGAVFYAYDKERGETVAIKKMSYTGKTAVEKWNDVIKEVQFLTSLHHANIVEYRSSFLKDSTCWLVMEYCIGSAADLVDVLKKGLREVEIAAICHCTLAALAYLHGLGRIHRDVKAGNILLTDAGIVKLADFGSASMTTPAHTFIGTPFFMAPEVILAMEDGQYAERADIWSMGITAIELAERRPPLFSMNAMSALYHIAQNEPPTLAQEDGAPTWSPAIKSFIASCLQKEASKRMTADQAREHPFVKNAYAPHILSELIARTKRLVRDLDNYQYKKLRKLMLLDEQKEGDNGTEDGDSSLAGGADSLSVSGCTTEDSLSRDDAGGDESSRGGAESPSSRSNSLTSLHSLQSVSGSSGRVPPVGELHNATVVSVAESMESGVGGSSGISAEISMRNAKEEVNTLRRSKFSTLRSTKKIITEVEEYRRENNLYEQMNGYKRLRQSHHKELQSLEERNKADSDALRIRLEKEMDSVLATAAGERLRLRKLHAAEMDKRKRDSDEGERKLRKQIMTRQQADMANYAKVQLKEYKHNKEKARESMRDNGLSKSSVERQMVEVKAHLAATKASAERAHEERLRHEADAEISSYKKSAMSRMHSMEDKRDEEEHDLEGRLLEAREKTLLSHHAQTADQERSQNRETSSMRLRHQRLQHEEEMANQKEYERRSTEELQKKHALQNKAQPRELKLKEAMIRKQYRQAVKTQTRQYKLWERQLLAAAERNEQKEIQARLKDEQKRKMAILGNQYESQIESMVQEKTVKLEEWQEDEARKLADKLSQEIRELQTYQERQKRHLQSTIDSDRERLEERITLRKDILVQKTTEAREDLVKTRQKAASARMDRHVSERAVLERSGGGGGYVAATSYTTAL